MSEIIDAFAVAGKAAFGFQAIFFALLAIGINVHFGYTGLLNFGQIAFAMLGGYGIAISVSQWGLPFWVGVVVGVFVQMSTLVIPNDVKYVGGLLLLIVILVIRPQGILGSRARIG